MHIAPSDKGAFRFCTRQPGAMVSLWRDTLQYLALQFIVVRTYGTDISVYHPQADGYCLSCAETRPGKGEENHVTFPTQADSQATTKRSYELQSRYQIHNRV